MKNWLAYYGKVQITTAKIFTAHGPEQTDTYRTSKETSVKVKTKQGKFDLNVFVKIFSIIFT